MSKTPEVKTCTDIECRKTGSDELCYDCGAPMKVGRYVFKAEVGDIDVPDKTPEEELAWALRVMAIDITTQMSITGKVPEDIAAIEEKAEKAILKHFVPKEEVNKVKMRDVVSPSPSPAAHKVIDSAMKRANDSQEQTIMYSDLAWCLGKLRGLGVPAEQLEAKYKLTNNQPNTPKGEGIV